MGYGYNRVPLVVSEYRWDWHPKMSSRWGPHKPPALRIVPSTLKGSNLLAMASNLMARSKSHEETFVWNV